MKILLANYRYFVSGGPERYMFNIKSALEQRGHEIIPFSIHYSKNEPTPYSRYFVPPLAGPDALMFRDHKWTARSFLKTLERTFYSREVERAISRLVADTRPDVAFVIHYLKKLSPALLVGMKKHDLPIAVMICDYLMMCPQPHFLRDGKACMLCARGNLWPSIRCRCVHGSLGASLIHYLSWRYHAHRHFFDLIDRFVLTNDFMLEQMTLAGWPREKMTVIPTLVAPGFLEIGSSVCKASPPYVLYVGHMEPHKGTDVLIRAYGRLAAAGKTALPRLVLVGDAESEFGKRCRALAQELKLNSLLEFCGPKSADELKDLYHGALFTVFPSTCFENLPNVVIESLASGTAVIGSGHGSIGPLIRHGETGLLFKPGDDESLAEAILKGLESGWAERAGAAAHTEAARLYAPDRHMELLLKTLTGLAQT